MMSNKLRGFKPGGEVQPIKSKTPSGPTIKEKLERDSRPTWENLKQILKKKETTEDFKASQENDESYERDIERRRRERLNKRADHNRDKSRERSTESSGKKTAAKNGSGGN